MITPLGAVVDWNALLNVVLASVIAGIGLTAAFSVAIVGATRFTDMRRDGRVLEASLFVILLAIGLVVSGAGVVFGIIVMTSK